MRTHTTTDVIDMLLDTKNPTEYHKNLRDDVVIVSEEFLSKVNAELKQLEAIALKIILIQRGGHGVDVITELQELQEMLARWDEYKLP